MGWNRSQLAYKVKSITSVAIRRAEKFENEFILSAEQDDAIRQTLERVGIEFKAHGVILHCEVPRGPRRGGLK